MLLPAGVVRRNPVWLEFLGYGASIMVALSMLMVSVVRLRVINLIGSIFFIVYGLLLPSVPVVLTNLFVVGVNIYHLRRAFRNGRSYCDYIPVGPEREAQLQEYLDVHLARIKTFYPYVERAYLDQIRSSGGQIFLAIHQLKVRGIAAWVPLSSLKSSQVLNYAGLRQTLDEAHKQAAGEPVAFLMLDYIDSKYRDLNLYAKLYTQLNRLKADGYKRMMTVCSHDVARSRNYLKARGFKVVASHAGLELLELSLPFL